MMKVTVAIIALLLFSIQSAQSQTCRDKFVHYLTEYKGYFPSENFIVSTPKGGKPSTNKFYMTKTGHWMTEMISPESPWTLAYNNTMYVSADKGKSWKKIRTMDSQKNSDVNKKNQLKNAETVKNSKCGEEEYNGIMHETVEADFTNFQAGPAETHTKHWINKENGHITKSVSSITAKSYSSVTTQEMKPAPDLVLPTPE